jgi:activator of HSP90 ATPase
MSMFVNARVVSQLTLGKILDIFDIEINMDWTIGTNTGKITIPELMHDTKEAEIVFDFKMAESKESNTAREKARSVLVPVLRKKLIGFAQVLLQGQQDIYSRTFQRRCHSFWSRHSRGNKVFSKTPSSIFKSC